MDFIKQFFIVRIISKILLMFLVFLFSCQKDTKTVTCPFQNYHPLPDFVKQFNFKKNSKWVFKNTSTLFIDTVRVWYSNGLEYNYAVGTSKECLKGDKYEYFEMDANHTMFIGGVSHLYFTGTTNGLYSSYYSNCQCSPIGVFENNIGDSIVAKNSNSSYSKLENIYPSITINGNTYNNVYQMFYYPDLDGFKRIWWCPNIGFVKFEYYNTTSSQTEFWELDSYNVQLY